MLIFECFIAYVAYVRVLIYLRLYFILISHGFNDCYIMVGADGTVLFSLWIDFSMIFWHFIINVLESFIDCTIIVIMQHVILYVVCLLSNCTVFIVLYSMYQFLAVFIAVSAVSVLVFFTFIETPPLAHAQKISQYHAPGEAK